MATARASTPCSTCPACMCSTSPGADRSARLPAGLRLMVETAPGRDRLPGCGVIAAGTAGGCGGCMTFRRSVRRWSWCGGSAATDASSRPARWAGSARTIELARPRAKLTTRAAWWAISCIQRDTASVASVARRLGVDWHTVWEAIKPLLAELADDPDRLAGVDTVGVDEHIWHHQPRPGKGPKEQTGIVDLTRRNGRPQARLLDLVPGRSGKAYADWLRCRGERSPPGSAPPPWIRSAATATRSATSSKTPPPSWTPSTSSGSA